MLKEDYTSISEKDKPGNKNKKVISDDAFAVCDFLEKLLRVMRRPIPK